MVGGPQAGGRACRVEPVRDLSTHVAGCRAEKSMKPAEDADEEDEEQNRGAPSLLAWVVR